MIEGVTRAKGLLSLAGNWVLRGCLMWCMSVRIAVRQGVFQSAGVGENETFGDKRFVVAKRGK